MSANYQQDYFGWTQEQAALIRAGQFSKLDLAHLADEIEDMGKSEKRALESRLEVLLMHLLKWQIQQDRRSKSWRLTIADQRRRLLKLLGENPSLKAVLAESIEDIYPSAVIAAVNETGLDIERFPGVCPYTQSQIFDADYWPD
ncbi:DUF29 domain-containing protein [Methylomagnum sp.]